MAHTTKKPEKPAHYLREWRKHNKLSLDQVTELVREIAASRVAEDGKKRSFKKLGATHGNLSRIERGEVPCNLVLLGLLAKVYKTDRISLLERRPDDPPGIRLIWDQIMPEQRALAADVLRTFIRKSGPPGR